MVHIIWLSDEVTQTTGIAVNQLLIYETIQRQDDWTNPAIVARPNQVLQPAMVGGGGGALHHAWTDDNGSLAYSTQVQYQCDDSTLFLRLPGELSR